MSRPNPQQPALTFPCKLTEEIDYVKAIRDHALQAFDQTNDPESHPDSLAADAKRLQELRKSATIENDGPTTADVSAGVLESMILYHSQLVFILTKFPSDIGVNFPWYPLFATPAPPGQQADFSLSGGLPATTAIEIPDLQFERCSVLINMAAAYASNATREDRTQAEGMKKATAGFSSAAGILKYVKESVLPGIALSAEDEDPPSPDLSAQTLDALINFCLAQAQEFYFQQAIANHSKNGVIARVALKVSEFYGEAFSQAMAARGAGGVWPTFTFPPAWLNHVSFKKCHFAAVAQYRKSIDDSAANRYGDELGRLHLAQKYVKQGLESSKKGVAQSVVVDIRSLQVTLADLITRAERDNSLIYLQAVTSEASLAPILSTALVKPTLPPDVEFPIPKLHTGRDGLGTRPLFERLLPYAVHLAISIYEERKENFIKEEIAIRREELDQKASDGLQDLGLPGSIQALEVPLGLPNSLTRKAEDLRHAGGTKKLRTLMQDALSVASTDRRVLDDVSGLLTTEEGEDRQLREHFGTERWQRLPSEELNSQLRDKIGRFSETLLQAGHSDKVVRSKFAEWEGVMQLLEGPQDALEAYVPSSSRRQNSYDDITSPSSQTSLVRELRRMLEDLDDLIAARRRTVDEARAAVKADNVRPLVMSQLAQLQSRSSEKIEAAHFEDLFERELEKYGEFRDTLAGNERQQQELLQKIGLTNEKFVAARQNDPILQEREEALQRLDIAMSKHSEILNNLSEALQFYQDFAKLLDQLRDTVREWVHARRTEAQGLVNALNMESMTIQETSQSPPRTAASPRPARPVTGGQAAPGQGTPRVARAQQPGKWQPGMPINFG